MKTMTRTALERAGESCRRFGLDVPILRAARLQPAWLEGDLAWFSQASGRERKWNRVRLVVHKGGINNRACGSAEAVERAL